MARRGRFYECQVDVNISCRMYAVLIHFRGADRFRAVLGLLSFNIFPFFSKPRLFSASCRKIECAGCRGNLS